MGNAGSTVSEERLMVHIVWLMNRYWSSVVESVDAATLGRRRRRRAEEQEYVEEEDEWCSEFSYSNFRLDRPTMAPNSEEEGRRLPAKDCVWSRDESDKELRPPVYNPEDYAMSLRKWGKRPAPPPCQLTAAGVATPVLDKSLPRGVDRDYRNPALTPTPDGGEMSLKQFNSITELLGKLKQDLRLAFPSFVQEFIGDPVDGVTLLLELLRCVQLSQAAQQTRCPPPVLRRALLDEHSCLLCLKHCLRCQDAGRRLAATPAGLFTLAVCIMSNVAKSRVLALELLTTACEPPGNGHGAVSEALSTLRLRFGEPVRFRFLVGMLMSSGGGGGDLQTAGISFINTFLETAAGDQSRLYIQAELEQAGFSVPAIAKVLPSEPGACAQVVAQLDRWTRNYVDVASLKTMSVDAEGKSEALQDKVALLERRVKILQEEKGILLSLEQCLKERCSQLETEVETLRRDAKPRRPSPATSPAEDEGISSSDQDDVEEAAWQRETSVDAPVDEDETTIDEVIEELRNIINDAESEEFAKEEERKLREAEKRKDRDFYSKVQEEKRVNLNKKEANIDQIPKITIQARNNDKYYSNTDTKSGNNKVVNYFKNNTDGKSYGAINVKITSDDNNRVGIKNNSYLVNDLSHNVEVVDAIETEVEIVPVKLLPQPPRKTRTVVQIVHRGHPPPPERFFDDSDSDSLLSAARDHRSTHSSAAHHVYTYQVNKPVVEVKKEEKERRGSFDGLFFVTDFTENEDTTKKMQSKSLDRIDEGLDSLVDIVIPQGKQSRFSSGRGSSEDWSVEWGDPPNYCVSSRPKTPVVIVTRSASIQQTTTTTHTHRTATPARRCPPDGSSHPLFRATPEGFVIKRGNAGMYSGSQQAGRRPPVPVPDYVRSPAQNRIGGHRKVTDLPSGLY